MAARAAWVRGVSLVEMVVTIGVLSIVSAFALPRLAQPLTEIRLRSLGNEFADAITLAQSEAARLHGTLVLCSRAATGGCSGSTNWNNGWLLFVDSNNNNSFDSGETPVLSHGTLPSNLSLSGGSSGGIAALAIISSGEVVNISGASKTLTLGASGLALKRYVVIAHVGRASVLDEQGCAQTNSGCTP